MLLGIFSALVGISSTYIGINAAFSLVPEISNISPQVLINGIKTSLITSFTGDWLYPPSENLMIVRALSAGGADVSFVNINSDKGHDAFLLEEPEFDDAMRGFINSVSLEANI